MVAKITVPNCIRRALNYNEQKVKEGKAENLYAHHFLKVANDMNFYEKLERFQSLIELNKRASTNCIHISLNFGLDEEMKKEQLVEIASAYMNKIGFGEQPYLVYKHLDAGHPHIHIVSTNIKKDGKRISLHNIGKNQSNTARKELEIEYKLQKAEDQKQDVDQGVKQVDGRKLNYGKAATKRGIVNVLDTVLAHYKYTSMSELNAVLQLYNVTADRGDEQGIIYKKRGLVYRALDNQGNKIGVPIKASSIYNKPTLVYMEEKFSENESKKLQYKKSLKTKIDWVMARHQGSLDAFREALEKERIALVIRQNDTGVIYGLTYIDHATKCVFNGSDIGKNYSAKAILEKCGIVQKLAIKQDSLRPATVEDWSIPKSFKVSHAAMSNLVRDIITPTDGPQYLPFELKKRTKKKRKNG